MLSRFKQIFLATTILQKLLLIFITLSPLITPIGYQGVIPPYLFLGAYFQTGVLVISSVWLLFLFKNQQLKISVVFLPLFAFLAWVGLSFYWSMDFELWLNIFTMWSSSALLFFLVYQNFNTKQELILLLSAVIFASLFIAILGISQHLFDFSIMF